LASRLAKGIETYGTPLQAHNGRDALWDAYEEALDLAIYLRQVIEERTPREDIIGERGVKRVREILGGDSRPELSPDWRVETWFNGALGQGAPVKVTHLPTGYVVTRAGGTQRENMFKAMAEIEQRIDVLRSLVCQVAPSDTARTLSCPARESGGYRCEVFGQHDRHWVGAHTMAHARLGNGYSCAAVESEQLGHSAHSFETPKPPCRHEARGMVCLRPEVEHHSPHGGSLLPLGHLFVSVPDLADDEVLG
jgi:hypothetical protein